MDTNIHSLLCSKTFIIILLTTGIAIRYIIGRRRFYRRGVGGLQHYPKYWIAIITTIIEWLFQWIANLLIIISVMLLLCSLER